MTQDARERAKWKIRLSDWADGLPSLIKRPVKKLILERPGWSSTPGCVADGTPEPLRRHNPTCLRMRPDDSQQCGERMGRRQAHNPLNIGG